MAVRISLLSGTFPCRAPFWMIPNLRSFTNIYARLNHRHGRRVKDRVLIHDEQLQLDQILRKSKAAAESMPQHKAVPSLRFANYDFAEQAQLTFARSDESAGTRPQTFPQVSPYATRRM